MQVYGTAMKGTVAAQASVREGASTTFYTNCDYLARA